MFLGDDGSLPTGTAPDIFLSGKTINWHVNKGSGSDFTESGVLEDADTNPGEIYAASPTDGLIGWWKLDEISGTGIIDYASGHDGTVANGLNPAKNSVNGVFGRGLDFTGNNARVEVPHTISLNPTGNDFSVSFWINPSVDWDLLPADIWHLLDKTSSGGIYNQRPGWRINVSGYHGQSIRLYVGNGADHTYFFSSGLDWEPYTWYFITIVFDGDSFETDFYRDGVLLNTFSRTAFPLDWGGTDLHIGDGAFNGGFDGKMDDVRIYDRELSLAEVQAMYEAARCINPERLNGTIVYNADQNLLQYCDSALPGNGWQATMP